jgi:hypothetical protein
MDTFDPNKLAYRQAGKQLPKAKAPRPGPGEKFLKGPIPWSWHSKAGRLKGHALHVGIVLWFLAGFKKGGTVTLSSSVLRDLGVTRESKYRGLKELESAGLISVDRHTGRNPVVTILGVRGSNGGGC